MSMPCRPWWLNCAIEADDEILAIDNMEDRIAPIGDNMVRVRELITGLELCHHKAQRWLDNIIEAIGVGDTKKGLGTRMSGQLHPAENIWQIASAALAAWVAGCPSDAVNLNIDTVPAPKLLACLGKRTPLKEWQVQRVIEKIRSLIHWPQSMNDPDSQYEWLLLSVSDYSAVYLDQCPERYKEHEDFWLSTARTIIHDTENGDEANLSLALAIDMLWPCHWRFVDNLLIVLEAIDGKLQHVTPFAACGRNINLLPIRPGMEKVSNTLMAFITGTMHSQEVDVNLMDLLGEPTEEKKWLAASLEKTIRLQLVPPDNLRVISALSGPDWIKS